MSIVSVNAKQLLDLAEDASGHRSCTVLYQVISNDAADGRNTILTATGLPLRGAPYRFYNEFDGGMFAKTRNASLAEANDSRLVWHVTIGYTSAPDNEDTQDDGDNRREPWDRKVRHRFYSSKGRKAVLKTVDGELIASSAGEPFDPVQERDETRFVLQVMRNRLHAGLIIPDYMEFRDKINDAPFYGFAARTVKVEGLSMEEQFHASGVKYWAETWEFAINTDGWDLRLYDFGYYRITDGKRKVIMDDSTPPVPINGPVFLNGAGVPLDPGDPPVFLPAFKLYETKNFDALVLPGEFE